MRIDVDLEEWLPSAVVRERRSDYQRKSAASFTDAPADLTLRQAVFYRNLIRLAGVLRTQTIPVDFELGSGTAFYLDRGCIKIAEHAGFIEPLEDGPDGVVGSIRLAWRVRVEQ
jgi:hypothetical protein